MIACESEVCAAKSADPRFAQQIFGSEVCVRDPRIIAQSSDPRFAQQNPGMVRIRTLRITYTLPIYQHLLYYCSVISVCSVVSVSSDNIILCTSYS